MGDLLGMNDSSEKISIVKIDPCQVSSDLKSNNKIDKKKSKSKSDSESTKINKDAKFKLVHMKIQQLEFL